jgi:hypothetical protein
MIYPAALTVSSIGNPITETKIQTFVDFNDEDTQDIVFPGGFLFVSDYHVFVTLYIAEADAPVFWNLVPRNGDPAPPAAKSPSGFRLVLSAPVTGRALVLAWAVP